MSKKVSWQQEPGFLFTAKQELGSANGTKLASMLQDSMARSQTKLLLEWQQNDDNTKYPHMSTWVADFLIRDTVCTVCTVHADLSS